MNSVKKLLAASFAVALLSVPVLASAQQQPAGGTPPAAGHAAHPRAVHTPRTHTANGAAPSAAVAHPHTRAHTTRAAGPASPAAPSH